MKDFILWLQFLIVYGLIIYLNHRVSELEEDKENFSSPNKVRRNNDSKTRKNNS